MRAHTPQTQTVIRIVVIGAMGWLMMACSIEPSPAHGETVAQTSQADSAGCMSDADCPSQYFCDFNIVDDPTLGGVCSPSPIMPCNNHDCRTFTVGPAVPSGGGSGAFQYCSSCSCTSNYGSFDGEVCGASTDELLVSCSQSC